MEQSCSAPMLGESLKHMWTHMFHLTKWISQNPEPYCIAVCLSEYFNSNANKAQHPFGKHLENKSLMTLSEFLGRSTIYCLHKFKTTLITNKATTDCSTKTIAWVYFFNWQSITLRMSDSLRYSAHIATARSWQSSGTDQGVDSSLIYPRQHSGSRSLLGGQSWGQRRSGRSRKRPEGKGRWWERNLEGVNEGDNGWMQGGTKAEEREARS